MAVVTWYAKDHLVEEARAIVPPAPVVLDVGCGIRPQQLVPCILHIGIEPHAPYIARLREACPDEPFHVLLQGTWDQAMAILPDASVDTIVAGDFIEHLEKVEGWQFLAEAARVARRQIVVFTPLGYFPQGFTPDDPTDRWGMAGGYWQQHRSGWTPDEFGEGWEILACDAYHTEGEQNQPLDKPFGAFYAIWTRP